MFHVSWSSAASNPVVKATIKVSAKLKWVATPVVPSLPSYYAVDFSTLPTIEVTANPTNPITDRVRQRLESRLEAMQSGDPSKLMTEGLSPSPLKEWIIIPLGAPKQPFAAYTDALFRRLVSLDPDKPLDFRRVPPPGESQDVFTTGLTVYAVDNIQIIIDTSGQGEEQTSTVPVGNLTPPEFWGPNEAAIPVEVHYYKSTCKRPNNQELVERIAKAVIPLYQGLHDLGLTLGSFDIEGDLPQYREALQNWKQQVAVVPPTPVWDPAKGQLRITSLDVVYNVAVLPVNLFAPLRERLSLRACDDLIGLPLTEQGQATYSYLVQQDPGVQTVSPNISNGTLTMTVTPQPTFAHLNMNGGPAYNNQYGWTGKASALGQDLIPRGRFYDISNALQVSYNGGPDSQNATASESFTKTSRDPMPKIEFYSASIGGNFFQNQNDRFGAEVPGQILTVSETQATAAVKLSYDSFSIFDISNALNRSPASRKHDRQQLVVPINFMFERFVARSNGGSYYSAGDITQFSISPDYLFSRDFDAANKVQGWSELDVEASAEYIKGIPAGGDIDFDRYSGKVSGTAFFGLKRTRQLRLEAQYGLGSLSAGGPIVRTFQLGGTQIVPGLQFGEVAGRTLAYAEAEVGLDFSTFFALFKRPVPTDISFFDITSSYLELEFGRASVSQGESLEAVVGLNPGVESFGPALQLGRVSNQFDLIAGYMYSPQSTIHRHGTFFLTVNITDIRKR